MSFVKRNDMTTLIQMKCWICTKLFEDYRANKRSGYCSLPCYWKSKKGRGGYWTGKKRSEEDRAKISLKRKGVTAKEKHPKWKGGTNKCTSCQKVLTGYRSKRCRMCNYENLRSENSIVIEKDGRNFVVNEKKHLDSAYRVWMLEVKKRDKWICKMKNSECEGRLEAHHIRSWRDHPELRYIANNGITLCHAHHPRKRAEEKRLAPFFTELVSVSKSLF